MPRGRRGGGVGGGYPCWGAWEFKARETEAQGRVVEGLRQLVVWRRYFHVLTRDLRAALSWCGATPAASTPAPARRPPTPVRPRGSGHPLPWSWLPGPVSFISVPVLAWSLFLFVTRLNVSGYCPNVFFCTGTFSVLVERLSLRVKRFFASGSTFCYLTFLASRV